MAIARLFNFKGGTPAIADQVDEEFANLIAAVEGVAAGAAGADAYQQGVLADSDWKYTGLAAVVNGATGSTTWGAIGGAAWLPGPAGALVRSFTPVAVQPAVKPPVLPGPGGFLCVGVELTLSGATALVSAVSGAEQVSAAAAIAHPAAVSAGKIRVFDYVITNTAGVITSGIARDRRPWALGARATREPEGELTTASAVLVGIPSMALRIECSGRPLRIVFRASLTCTINGTEAGIGAKVDGVSVSGFIANNTNSIPESIYGELALNPTPGSHLFEPSWLTTAGTVKMPFNAGTNVFGVEEVRANVNNGTA